MKVQVFAGLKEYFDREFELDTNDLTVEELKGTLTQLQPSVTEILSSCRFAVDDSFIDKDYKLKKDDVVSIIPPSSGG
jgi:molybdopterin synthase sulfur carrier subunit